jgi:PAS domain S-box-containing protein
VILGASLCLQRRFEPDVVLLSSAMLALGLMALLHGRFLQMLRARLLLTGKSLDSRDQEFRSVFEAALDAILVVDDQMICREANPAALKFFGVHREQLVGRSISVFGTDRSELFAIWKRLTAGEPDCGRLEMIRADGAKIAAEFAATSNMLPGRHLLVLHDATRRLQAEEAKVHSLIVTRAALEEARVLRTATLALTSTRGLNPVLDKLLQTLRSLIPFESGQVLLLESSTRLFLACDVSERPGSGPRCPETVDSRQFPALQRVLVPGGGLLIRDALRDDAWHEFALRYGARSWVGVPLCSRDQVIGLLSVMHGTPAQFTSEHLRLATCLATLATVAIESARLHEQAEIYSAELERRLDDVRRMELALHRREEDQGDTETN